uniref:Uncharacterized protein n=1 Tax=Anopheles stephensi TaxID=30069 RepID=A0A182YIB4_ANOST
METLSWVMVLGVGLCSCIVQECEEYRKMVTTRKTLTPLGLETKPIELDVFSCPNVADGAEATYGQFPHHALLGFPKEDNPDKLEFSCGGTLISDQHVLAAAQCFAYGDPTVVRLGEYNTEVETPDEYESDIDS